MEKRWEDLKKRCEECRACELSSTRTNCVFGTGNKNARLMFIGEAPGQKEDESGIPFVGAAGKLLNKYLDAVGIPREDVYIANILKCRPPKNRDPLPEEEDACIGYLREQVRLIRPKIIVCLGRIAAKAIIKEEILEIKAKYAQPRRTRIEAVENEIIDEDLVERRNCVLTLTHAGYIKRQATDVYSAQRRGGKGIMGMATKEEDYIEQVVSVHSHSTVMMFTNTGKVQCIRGFQILFV